MSTPDTNDSTVPPMFTDRQIRLLKIAVIGMGIVLLLGFLAVIARIVYLVNAKPKPAAVAAVAGQSRGASTAITLPEGAVIRHMALSGNRMALHFESARGAGVHIVELGAIGDGLTLPIVNKSADKP